MDDVIVTQSFVIQHQSGSLQTVHNTRIAPWERHGNKKKSVYPWVNKRDYRKVSEERTEISKLAFEFYCPNVKGLAKSCMASS